MSPEESPKPLNIESLAPKSCLGEDIKPIQKHIAIMMDLGLHWNLEND